jgi:internalin A
LTDRRDDVSSIFGAVISEDGARISLADRGLGYLPESLCENPAAVTSLNLRGNELTELPEWMREFSNLAYLDLAVNQLSELPEWIGSITKLIRLDAAHCQLTILPECLGNLSALVSLELGDNRLATVPESIGRLAGLTSLDLSRNRLATVPESIGHLAGLTSLDLSRNRLATVPESIGRLAGLTSLDLSRNRLATVPESIGHLAGLTSLDLSRNRLATVPESIGRLARLTSLDLSRNRLANLPDWLADLVALAKLSVGDNRLTSVPGSLGRLTGLTNLDLWGNRLTSVPGSLGRLTGLTNLDLWGNRLTSVPRSLGRLTGLSSLNLGDNRLIAVPDSLGALAALTNLDLSGNPLRSPLLEIAEEGTEAIKAFLHLMVKNATEAWMSKLLVVGQGGVGKTSLIKALTGHPYDPAEPSTHGIRIVDVKLNHPHRPHVEMALSSWDFGGQDIYHATHQFFLTDRSLFLLLWNGRQGWEQAKLPYWLDIIKARAPHARVLLVATHTEGRPADLPLTDLKSSYPQIVGSVSVDNDTRDGIDELRRMMAIEAAKLPLMGSRWPSTWVTGVTAVTKSGLQYATPEELQRRLTKAGVSDESHQGYLLRALHLLGEILYFNEDEELRDTIILKPQWVNEYISRVLDSPEVAARGGLLTRSHERQLWRDLQAGLRDRFLLMMEKFDLSYRITDHVTAASLVVERLPWESPPYKPQWEGALKQPGGREIRMRYQLNTLPPGIPTWFIAREHRFTTGIHWRSGALLRQTHDRRVYGLIRADHQDKSVELAVRGPTPQLFFSILQDGFESTLRRYRGLEITRLVPCNCNRGDGTQLGRPCMHLFQYGPLLRRLERNVSDVECELSFSKVSVAQLLFGIVPATTDRIMSRLNTIEAHLDEFRIEVAWAHREFLKTLRRGQARAEAVCPGVFTLTPADRKLRLPGVHRLALRLYCEQPGAFHPLSEAPYIIDQPSRWLLTLAPYLRTLLELLKHGTPLVGPALSIPIKHLDTQLANETALMVELVKQLPERLKIDRSQADHLEPTEFEADYRALYALLRELDPNEHWNGLNRTYTPEGQLLWLCRDHVQQYNRNA